jgi:hypothetical protein
MSGRQLGGFTVQPVPVCETSGLPVTRQFGLRETSWGGGASSSGHLLGRLDHGVVVQLNRVERNIPQDNAGIIPRFDAGP